MTQSDRAAPLITLTTDFGLADSYTAEMKGVIYGLNPGARIVDISHAVRPQHLLQAVFLTQSAWPAFPDGATHAVVVDPGVGTSRRAIALSTPRGYVVGPDNGVLSAALPDGARPSQQDGLTPIQLPPGYRAFAITNRRYLREPVSTTFHGRDVFAPAAAHLSLGVSAEELGERVGTVLAFPPLQAQRRAGSTLAGRVLHIDHFGNAVTDARAEDLPTGPFHVQLSGRRIPGPARSYAEAQGPVALVGGSGYLEIAQPNGSAAETLNIHIGDPVLIQPQSSSGSIGAKEEPHDARTEYPFKGGTH